MSFESIDSVGKSSMIIYKQPQYVHSPSIASSAEEPINEWSSLEIVVPVENPKKLLFDKGLYSPGSGEICTKQLEFSNSYLLGHPYFKYPAVTDPGIEEALLGPIPPTKYSDDGVELYKAICEETNTCLVHLFYSNLLNDEISLSYYGVSSKGVRAMALALQFNKHVKRFNLTENFLDNDACFHLGKMINSNVTLQELTLKGCRIGESGLRRLIKHLHINRTLRSLDLTLNCLGEEGGVLLAIKLDEGGGIQRLNLSKNKLGMKTAAALAETFEFRDNITHLDLSWNYFIHASTTVKLLDKLAFSNVLEDLNLSWNSLEGRKLARAIRNVITVPTLEKINISDNRFKDEDIEIIVEFLMKAKRLKTFDLSNNPISPIGAHKVIMKMLRPRVQIENLFLGTTNVNQAFMQCLQNVRKMKSRQNFVITHGKVIDNWEFHGSDARELILLRAAYLGTMRKHPIDIPLYFLKLSTEYDVPVEIKEVIKRIHADHMPLNEHLITEMSYVFPGKRRAKTTSVNFQAVKEYIHRLWPEKKLGDVSKMKIEPTRDRKK